jgi:hypothetical protein
MIIKVPKQCSSGIFVVFEVPITVTMKNPLSLGLHGVILQNADVFSGVLLLILSRVLIFEVLTCVRTKSCTFPGLHGVISPKLEIFSGILLLT